MSRVNKKHGEEMRFKEGDLVLILYGGAKSVLKWPVRNPILYIPCIVTCARHSSYELKESFELLFLKPIHASRLRHYYPPKLALCYLDAWQQSE